MKPMKNVAAINERPSEKVCEKQKKKVTNERKSCEEDSHVWIELKVRASLW